MSEIVDAERFEFGSGNRRAPDASPKERRPDRETLRRLEDQAFGPEEFHNEGLARGGPRRMSRDLVGIGPMTRRRRWTLAGVVAAVVVAVVRRWTSWGRNEYAIWPDEPAQLAIARFVGGGTRWTMDDHSVWRPLFGTLLSPVYLFTDDPTTVLHTALTVNALLGGVAAALLVCLARRLTPMTPPWSGTVAVLVSLTPAVLFSTDFVFAESLVAPLFLATLLALLRFHESPTLVGALVTALLAGAAFGAHSRMLPLAIITLVVIAMAAVQQRLAARDALAGAMVAVGALYVVSVYTAYIVDRLWDQPSTLNSIGGVRDQLLSGRPVLVAALGQTWYLVVASLGVIVYGSVVLARAALIPEAFAARTAPARADARLVLVAVGACVALSIVFMSDRTRSDQIVYGRYNDAVVTPLLVVGLASLIGEIPLRRLASLAAPTAIGIVAGGALLWSVRREVLSDSNGLEPMILGLQPFAVSPTSIDVIRISVWAAVLAVGLAATSLVARHRRRRVFVAGAVALLAMLAWIRTDRIVNRTWDDSGDLSAVERLRDGPLTDGTAVDFYLPIGSTSTNRMMLYQFHLPRTEFTVVNHPSDDATSPYVFALIDDDGVADAGGRLIWRDPRGRYGLWER